MQVSLLNCRHPNHLLLHLTLGISCYNMLSLFLRNMHPLDSVLLSLIAIRHTILTLTNFSVDWHSVIKRKDEGSRIVSNAPQPNSQTYWIKP
ncbi:hypothetical protein BT96DRAFT_313705 [Gymnopus androsaceus JB14]|uniref:Uncharacterized protein n=1 Tax=Gymnopus androsaceus JB14 TaxID=1447944 RepID=A0A6A4I6U2_9AGAR|nr:hypothetical protein BT96DRAFT_313705 [Gymnopus androsaceus JB14]